MGDVRRQNGVTVLHVSDMQFGQYHRFDAEDSLSGHLVRDLERLADHGVPPIDLVVVSGDLAERSRKSEYVQARAFVDAICKRIELNSDRFVIVPGNHDVNWDLCRAYFSECSANEEMPKPPYSGKWKHFRNFVNGIHKSIAFTDERPYCLHRFDGLGVVVAALNSTIRETHLDDGHYGWCGRDQLLWFADQLRDEADSFRIGVLHHNVRRGARVDDENLRDSDDLTSLLGGHLDLLLHGHTHEGKADHLSDGTLVLATGSAAVNVNWRPLEVPNQYQILRLSRGGLTQWARQWDAVGGKWIADPRISRTGNEWCVQLDLASPGWRQGKRKGDVIVATDLASDPRAPALSGAGGYGEGVGGKRGRGFLDCLTDVRSFSTDAIRKFRSQLRSDAAVRFPPELSEWDFLRQAGLMENDRLTRAGVLLFGEEPSNALPAAIVQCAHYRGDSRTAPRDLVVLSCNMSEQIFAAHDFVASRVRIGDYPSADTARAQPVYRYPMIAVRELIANAVVHRAYEMVDFKVHVRLFSDRLEIASPGEWLGGGLEDGTVVPMSRLEGESRCRNLHLASALTWISLVEGEGSGIPAALRACRDAGAREPAVRQKGGVVTVTVYPTSDAARPPAGLYRPLGARGTVRRETPGIRSSSGSGAVPIFFLSYARDPCGTGGPARGGLGLDDDVLRFYKDLCLHVQQLVGSRTGTVPGFVDWSMTDISEKRPRLLNVLETAPIFVALLSADYVDSAWCGKEWDAFSRRRPERKGGNGRDGQTTILPVVWLPLAAHRIPPVIESVQRFAPKLEADDELCRAYLENGVYGLLAVNSPYYDAVVWHLARLVSELYYAFVVPPGDQLSVGQLCNAFERNS